MKRSYRNYTDEDVIKASSNVKSIAGLCRAIGIKPVGGNYANLKRIIQRLKIDTSHWTGQGWNKNEQLKDWSNYTRNKPRKKILIKERGHKCENCKNEKWLNEPITLELHHIDGDKTNNKRENLQLLCPNCHSFTKNWRK
jgi:hypothetical protein